MREAGRLVEMSRFWDDELRGVRGRRRVQQADRYAGDNPEVQGNKG